MTSEEWFDILDEQMNVIGKATRNEAHDKGLWHQTFHCWIVSVMNGKTQLLFQKRHPGKDTFPGLLDTSCAGHLSAGETVEDGVRELEEELGIVVTFDKLIPCGIYREVDAIEQTGGIDREFCHIYLLRDDRPLMDYRLQEDEVTGLYLVSPEDLVDLVEGRLPHVVADGVELSEQGELQPVKAELKLNEFCPHELSYYNVVLDHLP